MDLDYAGDISPSETWEHLKNEKNSYLIDCRTSAEWSLVGVPDLDSLGKRVCFIEWQTFPTMEKNSRKNWPTASEVKGQNSARI